MLVRNYLVIFLKFFFYLGVILAFLGFIYSTRGIRVEYLGVSGDLLCKERETKCFDILGKTEFYYHHIERLSLAVAGFCTVLLTLFAIHDMVLLSFPDSFEGNRGSVWGLSISLVVLCLIAAVIAVPATFQSNSRLTQTFYAHHTGAVTPSECRCMFKAPGLLLAVLWVVAVIVVVRLIYMIVSAWRKSSNSLWLGRENLDVHWDRVEAMPIFYQQDSRQYTPVQ